MPGFRPGKAPRKLLEARLGEGVARGEALRDAIPDYYAQAVREHDVDVIAAPEIEITDGEDDRAGRLRRRGRGAARSSRPRLREPAGHAAPAGGHRRGDRRPDRPDAQPVRRARDRRAARGRGRLRHHRRARLAGRRSPRGPHRRGLLLRGGQRRHRARAGRGPGRRRRPATSCPSRPTTPIPRTRRPALRGHRSRRSRSGSCPRPTDEWAAEASEFETLAALRDDLSERMTTVRKMQAQMYAARQGGRGGGRPGRPRGARAAGRQRDAPAPRGLRHAPPGPGPQPRPVARPAPARTPTSSSRSCATTAARAAKFDLALRAVADAEQIEATEDDLEAEFGQVAQQLELDARGGPAAVRGGRPDERHPGRHPPAQGAGLVGRVGRDRRRGRQPARPGRLHPPRRGRRRRRVRGAGRGCR